MPENKSLQDDAFLLFLMQWWFEGGLCIREGDGRGKERRGEQVAASYVEK